MIIIDIIASAAIGALSGMGIGGGGLLVIYLTVVRGVGQITAQGVNLYFFIFASVAALFVHMTKRKINFSVIAVTSAFGVAGAVLGSSIAAVTDPDTVRRIFGWMLIASGVPSCLKSVKKHLDQTQKR